MTGPRSEGVKVDRERRTRRVPKGEDYLYTESGGGPALDVLPCWSSLLPAVRRCSLVRYFDRVWATTIIRVHPRVIAPARFRSRRPILRAAPQSLIHSSRGGSLRNCPTDVRSEGVSCCPAISRLGTSSPVEPSMRAVGGGDHAIGPRSSCQSVARASIPRLTLPTPCAFQ